MENNNIKYLAKSMEKLQKKNSTIFNSIKKLYITNETIEIFKEKAENSNFSLKLSSNPFLCDCSSVEVASFLKLHYSQVNDYKNVSMMCIDGEKRLFHQNEEDFCPETLLFTIVSPVIIVCVIFCIILIINTCYKETIMIYIFSKSWGKIFFSEDTIDKE